MLKVIRGIFGFLLGLAIAGGGVFLLLWAAAQFPPRPTVDLKTACTNGDLPQARAHLFWDDFPVCRPNDPLDSTGIGPLHVAAREGHVKLAELLIAKGAQVNSLGGNGFGLAPLHLAVLGARRDMAELLIANDADVSILTSDGKTPLDLARAAGNKEMIDLLKKGGATAVHD